MNFKVFLLLIMSIALLFGCEEKTYYMNVEGYISFRYSETIHTPRKGVHDIGETINYIVISIDGKDYRTLDTTKSSESLLIGNKVKLQISPNGNKFSHYEILEDDNIRMREQLLKESKELESTGN